VSAFLALWRELRGTFALHGKGRKMFYITARGRSVRAVRSFQRRGKKEKKGHIDAGVQRDLCRMEEVFPWGQGRGCPECEGRKTSSLFGHTAGG